MSYGYGRQNPFDQRDPPSNNGGYPAPAAPSYNQGGRYDEPGFRDDYGQRNVEMAPLARNAGAIGGGDPNAVLNECRSIDQGIEQIEQSLQQIRMLQDRSLNEADSASSTTTRQLDSLSSETMAMYRSLTERVRQVKSQREAQQPKNAPQVGRVDRRLKAAIQSFQEVDSTFRKKTQAQMARQYRIVKPEASEDEVRAVVEDTTGNQQVFQQAMMQSDRRGQARAVLSAVQERHDALLKIERQIIELAQLFQDMDTLVVQQDAQIIQIEQKGEEVVENLDKGNDEIEVAVKTAKSTRKKKWICLGICVAVIVVVAIVVVAYIFLRPGGASGTGKKRDLEIRGSAFEDIIPGIRIGPQLTASLAPSVLPGGVFNEAAPRIVKRAAQPFDSTEDNSSGNIIVKRTIRPPHLKNHLGEPIGRRYLPRPKLPTTSLDEN